MFKKDNWLKFLRTSPHYCNFQRNEYILLLLRFSQGQIFNAFVTASSEIFSFFRVIMRIIEIINFQGRFGIRTVIWG